MEIAAARHPGLTVHALNGAVAEGLTLASEFNLDLDSLATYLKRVLLRRLTPNTKAGLGDRDMGLIAESFTK